MFHNNPELVRCSRERYGEVVKGLRGDRDFVETFSVLSGYTRVDGDQYGPGKCIETVWGLGVVPMFGCRLQDPDKGDEFFVHRIFSENKPCWCGSEFCKTGRTHESNQGEVK